MWHILLFVLCSCQSSTPKDSKSTQQPTVAQSTPQSKQLPQENKSSEPPTQKGTATGRYSHQNIGELALSPPSREAKVTKAIELSDAHLATKTFLEQHLRAHASSSDNPWALFHSLLAFGADHHTDSGELAVDAILSRYAVVVEHNGKPLLSLPSSVEKEGQKILIEPHADLGLKVLTEIGLSPDHPIQVNGEAYRFQDLYAGSLLSTYLLPQQNISSYHSTNDMPWGIQALSAYAPTDLRWMSTDRTVPMTMDDLTLFGIAVLAGETQFMKATKQAGAAFERKGQGIFKYTCGGAHLLQGISYAVARGFGGPKARPEIEAQIELLYYRFPIELQIYDSTLQAAPKHKRKLLVQRLKFVGHFIESTAKLHALGFYTPNDQQLAMIKGAADQLALVVQALRQEGVFEDLEQIKSQDPQMYLDLLGDAGHAVYALDLMSGQKAILY